MFTLTILSTGSLDQNMGHILTTAPCPAPKKPYCLQAIPCFHGFNTHFLCRSTIWPRDTDNLMAGQAKPPRPHASLQNRRQAMAPRPDPRQESSRIKAGSDEARIPAEKQKKCCNCTYFEPEIAVFEHDPETVWVILKFTIENNVLTKTSRKRSSKINCYRS